MAIEDNVNLKRDVQDNAMELEYAFDEIEEIWDELANLANSIGRGDAVAATSGSNRKRSEVY